MNGSVSKDEQLQNELLAYFEPRLTRDRYLAQTLTFKPRRSGRLGREAVVGTLEEYLKRLQRKTLGRRYSRDEARLQVVPMIEGGEGDFDKHLHVHALTEIPEGFGSDAFARLSAHSWRSLGMASQYQHRHQPCDDVAGWLDYLTKVSDKPCYLDSLVVECLHL